MTVFLVVFLACVCLLHADQQGCTSHINNQEDGITAGNHRERKGSGTNHLCLHKSQKGEVRNRTDEGHANLYGAEYEADDGDENNLVPKLLPDFVDDQEAPCTVCRTKSNNEILMIPGTTECSSGWKKEYDGHIMTSMKGNVGTSKFICVDKTADVIGEKQYKNELLLYPTEVKCGSLPCPPYVDGREVPCVVCSG